MSDDLIKRLEEPIVADAFNDGRIQSGMLAERLVKERVEAAMDLREAATALAEAQTTIARLEAALRSIAANTCCEGCQEAARVARAALSPVAPDQGEG